VRVANGNSPVRGSLRGMEEVPLESPREHPPPRQHAAVPLPSVPVAIGAPPHMSSPVPRGAGSESKASKKPSGLMAWLRKRSGGSSPLSEPGGSGSKKRGSTPSSKGLSSRTRSRTQQKRADGFTQDIEEQLGAMRLNFGDEGGGRGTQQAQAQAHAQAHARARGGDTMHGVGTPTGPPTGRDVYLVEPLMEARRVVEGPKEFHSEDVRAAAMAFIDADRAAHLAVAEAASRKAEFLVRAAEEPPRPLFEVGDSGTTPPSLRTSPTTVPEEVPEENAGRGLDADEIARRKVLARKAWAHGRMGPLEPSEEGRSDAFQPSSRQASWTPFSNEDNNTGYMSGSDDEDDDNEEDESSSSMTPHQGSQGSISPFELTPAKPVTIQGSGQRRREALLPEDCTSSEEERESGVGTA